MATRKIIDPKQNGEKVWLKGHAKATFMSDGTTVEDAVNNIAKSGADVYVWDMPTDSSSGTITSETYDALYNAPKIVLKQDNGAEIEMTKMMDGDTILLHTIQTTMMQSSDVNYMYIVTMYYYINPDYTYTKDGGMSGIPTGVNLYSKPSGGIPKTDLTSAVQTSLSKADTALQSYTEQYKGTVTSVKINGVTKSPTSGVVDLGTVITSHQDISGKQDKLVSGTNIKTINGASILGSGNITIEGGGSTNQFYITDFTISDLQQLVNGDITEVSANCSALSQALQNNQIIVIPYGLTEDGYFGYSLPDVYYEDLLYMTITDSGSGIVYAIEVGTNSNYIHSDNVSIVNNNNGDIVQGGSAIDLKIDFYQLYLLYSANQESDTIELNEEGCVDTLFRELTWGEVESLIRAGTYSFFTTNNFIDAEADRISCPVVVGYDAQGRIKSLHIYSQAAGVPMYDYNYVITFMTGDYCSITRYRTGGYTQTNMGTNTSYSTLLPNEFYVWDEVTELNIDLDLAWADSTKYTKEYVFQFTSGSEPTTLTLPDGIKWANGEAPVIEANKIYQISILNGLGTVMSWDNTNLISFSVMWGVSSVLNFECEKDMTWEAFVASSYNTDSALKISNGNIWYRSYRIEDATPTSIIENGKMYTSIYDD